MEIDKIDLFGCETVVGVRTFIEKWAQVNTDGHHRHRKRGTLFTGLT